MSKGLIFGIIGVSIVIILVILFSGNSAQAAPDNTIAELGAVLNSGGNKKKDCRKTCQMICKSHGWFFKGRGKCKKACKADCGRGIDVTKNNY